MYDVEPPGFGFSASSGQAGRALAAASGKQRPAFEQLGRLGEGAEVGPFEF
jgi:hypothetical protein